jgi:hypothetical protein
MMRTQMARAAGVENQRRDYERSDFDIDYLGIRAEMAVSKLYGLPFDPRAMGVDAGQDLWVDEHISIDVKASFHGDAHLLYKSLKSFRSDFAILVIGTAFPQVLHVSGWVSRDRFAKESKDHQLAKGKGIGRVLHKDMLSTPDTFTRRMAQERFKKATTLYPLLTGEVDAE